jgi:hypothetical protein
MSADPTPPEEPKTLFDKIGAALPIALTAVATAFAGLSSSEMSRAMYWRSAAAQDQAKVNDQWSLAGFKRDRSLIVQTAAAVLRAGSGGQGYTVPPANGAADQTPAAATAREWMAGKGPPRAELSAVEDPLIQRVLEDVRKRRPEAEVVALARGIDAAKLEAVIAAAAEAVAKAEEEADPVLKEADRLAQASPAAQAARFELDYRRYRNEATLNQGLGFLYEVRVKKSTAESDRHRVRSENFFYAMLAGQIGAVIASLQLARKHGSALWGLAGAAGLIAVGFGVYVYLGM